MDAEKRRAELLKLLRKSVKLLTGGTGRIFWREPAGYRAGYRYFMGFREQILASLQGYLLNLPSQEAQLCFVVACRHTREQIETSWALVDQGGRILMLLLNTVYGELRNSNDQQPS